MLRKLVLHHVGPASRLALDPIASRVNLIAGDNGLGKSFILETAWWALTRTWHEVPAVPTAPNAKIEHHFDSSSGVSKAPTTWDPRGQRWKRTQGRPANPGLVLYARVDGSFSVWDPARNYRLYSRRDGGEAASPDAYQFPPRAVLWGLKRIVTLAGTPHEETLCRGLIDDWAGWQETVEKGGKEARFDLLRSLLSHIGPDNQPLEPGGLARPTPDDDRVIPTIRMPYGQDVPITYAPAGVKRMTKLAYLFAWVLSSHLDEVARQRQAGQKMSPADQVIVLLDEPETHLHPRWQRTVLPGLVQAIGAGRDGWKPRVQFLVATHSPLVLASMEPMFDPALDALWKLDLAPARDEGSPDVVMERDAAYRRGDAARWLQSDVFDHTSPYSKEAEAAIARALDLVQSDEPSQREIREVTHELRQSLSEIDRFWTRWAGFARDHGVDA